MTQQIVGSGGGKSGGGGGGITEAADTLSSVAFAQFVDALGEGPISGLVNGEFSIYLDGVPLRDLSGTPNYKPFGWIDNKGLQFQDPLPGFQGNEQEVSVGLQLKVSTGALVRDITDADADAVRVTVSVNGLTQTTTEGRINGTKVSYRIKVRQSGGAWQALPDETIQGKTGSNYQRSHKIELAPYGAGPFQVSVERLTADSTSALLVNNLFWDSYATINYEKLTYPNTALVGIRIDARYFSQIPTRSYHVRGLIIKVPKNYNPVTRLYATTGEGTTNGAWDGTFKTAYSNNPAWCYYDILTNRRYGLGKRVSEAQIDKWKLYQIGVYCDGLVPKDVTNKGTTSYSRTGGVLASVALTQNQGAHEPRFTLNCVINSREDAYKVLAQLATVFRAMPYWSSNMVALTQDQPSDPVFLFNNSNVEAGVFNYEGSSRSQRNTVVMVAWNDPAEDFRQKFEYVEDRLGVQRYGVKNAEVTAFGCTSRSQARRFGLWMLYTQRLETEAITFKAGLDASFVVPGDVVQIMDQHRLGARWGGRINSCNGTTLVLDDSVVLPAGVYTISLVGPDGSVLSRTVTLGGTTTVTSFTMNPTVPALAAGTVWTLSSTTALPKLARVVQVKEDEPGVYEFTTIEHNPAKYAAVESDAILDDQEFSFLSYESVAAVTGLKAVETTYQLSSDNPTETRLDVSWDKPSNPLIAGFVLRYTGTTGVSATLKPSSETSEIITGLAPDVYTVYVKAVNHLGRYGPEAKFTVALTGMPTLPPDQTLPPAASGLTATVSFSAVVLQWTKPVYLQGGGNAETRIYYADEVFPGNVPTRASALLLTKVMGTGNAYTDNLSLNVKRYYWVDLVSRAGSVQAVSTGPVTALTAKVTSGQVDGRGLDILDVNGNPVFSSDGSVSDSAYMTVDGNVISLSAVAANSLVPSLNFVGEFASAPTQVALGDDWRQNSVYRNTTDSRTYVLTGSPLDWVIYLESGTSFSLNIESSNGTVFRPGQSQSTMLMAHLFKNGAEVTEQTPASWFRWRRLSAIPQQAPNDDATWNTAYATGYRQVMISVDSVYARATFFCDILS